MVVDASGRVYVAGLSSQTDFPAGAFQTAVAGSTDGFVTKFGTVSVAGRAVSAAGSAAVAVLGLVLLLAGALRAKPRAHARIHASVRSR